MGEHEENLAAERARLQRAAYSRDGGPDDLAALARFEERIAAEKITTDAGARADVTGAVLEPVVDPAPSEPEPSDVAELTPSRRRWMPVAIGVAVVLVIGAIVAVRPLFVTSADAPAQTSASPRPSDPPSTAQAAVALSTYPGPATCDTLIDIDTLRMFQGKGWNQTSDSYEGDAAQDENSPAHRFVVDGGLLCAWGDADQAAYAYAPISASEATNERARLSAQNLVPKTSKGLTTYSFAGGKYIFGSGFWLYTTTAAGDFTRQLVANVPENAGKKRTDLQSALYVTSEGLGDLRLGKPVPASSSVATWKANACGADAGAYRPRSGYSSSESLPFDVVTRNRERGSALTAILIYSNAIPTKSGIRVGDSVDKVEKAFPGIEKKNFELSGTAGKIKFQTGPLDGDDSPQTVVTAIFVVGLHDAFPAEDSDGNGSCVA